jgi:hypothetical protein
MATLVKFLKDEDGEVFAYFPQLKFDNQGNRTCYAHIEQHSACNAEYAAECEPALFSAYADLYQELTGIGYDLKVLNK